jgi:hypothetical protein
MVSAQTAAIVQIATSTIEMDHFRIRIVGTTKRWLSGSRSCGPL